MVSIGDVSLPSRITPADAGLQAHPLATLRGGDARENAAALRRLLQGERGAYRDAVLLNAAATLIVAGKTTDWVEGTDMARAAIDSDRALDLLKSWIAMAQ